MDQRQREQHIHYAGGFKVEPSRMVGAPGYPWKHEIRVALPLSYANTSETYPVLWVTDNELKLALSTLSGLELIVVGIGPKSGCPPRLFNRRRIFDFYPIDDFYPTGPAGDFMRERDRASCPRRHWYHGGGADAFLRFLVEDVRPTLASEYRMDANDHCLEGHSAGGWFVVYTLLTRPESFKSYIASSPALSFCGGMLFDIETVYAKEHDDLQAGLFLGIGDQEMTETPDHILGCFSSTARMAEILTFRKYPSLYLNAKVFAGETHASARAPIIAYGVRSIWGPTLVGVQ